MTKLVSWFNQHRARYTQHKRVLQPNNAMALSSSPIAPSPHSTNQSPSPTNSQRPSISPHQHTNSTSAIQWHSTAEREISNLSTGAAIVFYARAFYQSILHYFEYPPTNNWVRGCHCFQQQSNADCSDIKGRVRRYSENIALLFNKSIWLLYLLIAIAPNN